MGQGFYASFNKFSDMTGVFDGAANSFSDTDPFENSSDTDPTGLEGDIEAMEDTNPFETDDEATEDTEDIDSDDVEPGEDFSEDEINEVDLDFDPDQIEPDWAPDDDISPADEATGTSHEDESADTQLDDAPYDEWDEVTPDQEISQEDDVSEVDDIAQWEEVGLDEPLFYPVENDTDFDLTNEAEEEIVVMDQMLDPTDAATDDIAWPGLALDMSRDWVDNLEDFLDFTEQDTTSFHDGGEGYEITDGYDPEYPAFMADRIIDLPNLVDDVFADVFPEPINAPFSWFDDAQ